MRKFVISSFLLLSIAGCGGGGGGGSSSAPVPQAPSPGSASDDEVTLVEDNTVSIDVLGNDSNVVANTISVDEEPANGSVTTSSGQIVYTPDLDFTGEDTLTYSVEGEDGTRVAGTVTITVTAVTLTRLEVQTLSIPTSGYVSANDAELGASILASPELEFTVPPNAISLVVSLGGADVNIESDGLFISRLVPPSGPFINFQRFVNFCFEGNCSSLIPRAPGYVAESGSWTIQVATKSDTLDGIDLSAIELTVATRTGPDPDFTAVRPAALTVQPFSSAATVAVSDIEDVLARVVQIASENQIELIVDPITSIEDERFTEVSASFLDENTQALVGQGSADTVNLFFIEEFSDASGLAGVTGSIPGSSGSSNGHNGTLLNAGGMLESLSEQTLKDAAETTFHEIGHLLGLYHTTESRFSFNDVLDDTPDCEASVHDINDDGVAASTEYPDAQNPMFWQNSVLTEWEPLTDDQKYVIYYSPLAVPGTE